MKKILVPIDFSECSANALKVAASVAKKQDADIIALHMIGLSEAMSIGGAKEEYEIMHYIKLVERRFQEFLDKDYLEGINITDTVYNYQNFTAINDIAKEHNASLIIMGSHCTSGFKEMFVWSNTVKVVFISYFLDFDNKIYPKVVNLVQSNFILSYKINTV